MTSIRTTWKTALLSAGLLLTACGGNMDEEATEGAELSTGSLEESMVSPELASTRYSRAHDYASAHPKFDGGVTWSGHCGSLMYRFCELSQAYPTAIAGYKASTIKSKVASGAPAGAFHWFSIGTAGHVGVDLKGGGGTVFMGSSYLSTSWGTGIGFNSVSGYVKSSGATYLGWSTGYGAGGSCKG